MPRKNIKVVKTEGAEESVELLAKSIVQVAEASEKLMNAGLNRNGLVTLIHRGIGAANINRYQIELVLDALPRLKAWYVKK